MATLIERLIDGSSRILFPLVEMSQFPNGNYRIQVVNHGQVEAIVDQELWKRIVRLNLDKSEN